MSYFLIAVVSAAVGLLTGWWLRGKNDSLMLDILTVYNEHTPLTPTEAYCMGRPWTGDDDLDRQPPPLLKPLPPGGPPYPSLL